MAAIRMVYIDCDTPDCLANTAEDATPPTAAEARERARDEGWRRRNGQDLCPSCAAGDGPVDASGWPRDKN